MKLIRTEFKFGDGQFMFVSKKIDSWISDLLFTKVKIIFNLRLIMLINVQNSFHTLQIVDQNNKSISYSVTNCGPK